MHSARVIYYVIYTQRAFRKGLFITQCIVACIQKGVGGERGKTWVTVNIHNEITMPTVETKYEKNNIA